MLFLWDYNTWILMRKEKEWMTFVTHMSKEEDV